MMEMTMPTLTTTPMMSDAEFVDRLESYSRPRILADAALEDVRC
jgi:hypothetical protein